MKDVIKEILRKYNLSEIELCADEIVEVFKPHTTRYTKEQEEQFDEFRLLYGGVKRGNKTEFEHFIKKTRDWKFILPTLKSSVVTEIAWRKLQKDSGKFVPEWKNMQTWINNRCWETEYELPKNENDNPTREEMLKDLLFFPDYQTTKCGKYIKVGNVLREV